MGGVGRRRGEEGRRGRKEKKKKNHIQPHHSEVRKVHILELIIMDDF